MGKKSVEANSNNKQCENDTIVIERFSKKRYETYKAKGIPFKVVCGSDHLCEIRTFDCGVNHDQVLVEILYKFLGKDDVRAFYIPCTKMAQDMGTPNLANIILLGKVLKECPEIGMAGMEDALKKVVAKRPEMYELNLKAVEAGYNYQ